jgi:hypothetical protein
VGMVLDDFTGHTGAELTEDQLDRDPRALDRGLPVMTRGSMTIRSCRRALWIMLLPAPFLRSMPPRAPSES